MILFIEIILLLATYQGLTQEITFNDYTYTVFTTTETIQWTSAETHCVNLGGNLVTVYSKQIDSLLFHLTAEGSCWIGLNDIATEAGNTTSAFVWVDGSNSTYRQFASNEPNGGNVGNGVTDKDCVDFRAGNMRDSDGWDDRECDAHVRCYFCQKSGDSRGCDLIYEGSCYRAFEVSDGINWLDAQSSCAVWGGDLTSITTERENNLLYTAISDTVSNCWIGLYERDGDGMYQWVDGTVSSYSNWTGSAPTNGNTNDCVQMNTNEAGSWIATDCEGTSNSFICNRPSTSTVAIVGRFGELTNGAKNFQELSENTFYFNSSLTLVCGGEEDSNAIQWIYREYLNSLTPSTLTPTYASTVTGLSWITVNNSQQGYYTCVINSYPVYTIGLYDLSLTTVAVSGSTYTYIVGVDRESVLLLCDPMDSSSVTLSTIAWTVLDGMAFINPINIFDEKRNLPAQSTEINCYVGSNLKTNSTIMLKAPELTIRYSSIIGNTFSSVYPSVNSIAVPISTRDITISINIDGKWNLPDNGNSYNSELTIPIISSVNPGLYKFYISNWDGEEECAMQLNIVLTNPGITADNELIFGNSTYGYITTALTITWLESQLNCNNWGGNLATIYSKQIDSLLFYLTSEHSCWIGLNDNATEAGNTASAFVWVDGSTSTYRQFASNEPNGGDVGNDKDCVDFRLGNMRDSDGWDDRECYANVKCYFCQKSGDSRGCDLIYEGSCYRAFEVSDGINWLDAQSSCAVWGGDLTSITTERENNLLYTAISDTVSNCWIGLYERDGDGMYQWVDGTVLSYTNWAENEPNNRTAVNCVYLTSNGNWSNIDCGIKRNWFICETDLANISPANIFGKLTDHGLDFLSLTGDIFLYDSPTLACKGDSNSDPITWQYSDQADLSSVEVLVATYSSTLSSWSWIQVDNTKQGYYQCSINGAVKYIVGVYNSQKTTVASEGASYQYMVGIDREDILLLCDPMDSSYELDSLSWRVMNGDTFSNPINIFSTRNSLPEVVSTEIQCVSNSVTLLTSYIRVLVPQITVTSGSSTTMSFDTICPGTNTIQLEIGSDVSISTNSMGRWKLPDDTYVSISTIQYYSLQYNQFGVYQFYADKFDGTEVCVQQITINLQGYSDTNFITLSNSETIQNGSTIVSTEDSTVINCVISNPSYSVEWFYTSQLGDAQNDVTESSTFSVGTGISTLTISSEQPGYYSCVVNTDIMFSFYLADRDTLVQIENFDSPTQQVNYTAGDTSSMLYYSHANIPDISLRWTTDTVTDGADTQYSIEYPNPVLLSRVFSDVGAGVHTFSCFYRMSPVTLVGSLKLVIRDDATVSIAYRGFDKTFSDANNPIFPSPQMITIPEGTHDVSLTCSLTTCMWKISLKAGTTTLSISEYIIPIFNEEHVGNYSILRITEDSQGNYTTARVYIQIRQNPSVQPSNSVRAPIIIAIAVIIIAIVVALIVVIPILCMFVVKKRKQFIDRSAIISKHKNHSNVTSREGNTGYANLADLQSPTKEYIELPFIPTGTKYMTIDETNLIPLEMEAKDPRMKTPYYSNLANLPSNVNNYEMIKENNDYVAMKPTQSFEHYAPMSAVKEEKKFLPKYIPSKEFPSTYQRYVASGMGHDSLFSVEIKALNEESIKNVESNDEARKEQNLSKNPIKNILPYDENRVVLESQYFECNYINASWLENSQFIASIHPTGNTLQDFLQMIYQTEASMVIMLSTRKEKAKILGGVSNRVCYWPKKDEILKCDPFETNLISSNETTAFIKQEISLKHCLERKSHSFIHCISPIWNEDGTVVDVNSVIILLTRVLKQKQDYPLNPIIIHCGDGISKTGVFLTVFNVIKELNIRKSINIFNAVKNLRKQRMSMVPTMACYTTCYSLMNEYCSIHL